MLNREIRYSPQVLPPRDLFIYLYMYKLKSRRDAETSLICRLAYYMCVCPRACVRACVYVRACIYMCVCACARALVCARPYVCLRVRRALLPSTHNAKAHVSETNILGINKINIEYIKYVVAKRLNFSIIASCKSLTTFPTFPYLPSCSNR